MARIVGVSPTTRNPLLRLIFWYVRRRFGRDVEPMRGYATNGGVLGAMVGLELGMERAHRVDKRLKKLAELRAAALVGCPFCLDIGSALVRQLGVPERKLRELNRFQESDAFTPLEKAVLAYTDRMTATPVEITDDDLRELRAHFDEGQLVELTAAIAHENLRARINHALGYGSAGFSEGGFCALTARETDQDRATSVSLSAASVSRSAASPPARQPGHPAAHTRS